MILNSPLPPELAIADARSDGGDELRRSLRVLMIAYHFPPSGASGSFRLLGFSRHLSKFGWQVAVVAPPAMPWEPFDAALAARIPDDAAVYRAPYPSSMWSKPVRRVAPYAAWLMNAWPVCLRAMRHFQADAVLTSGPPHCVHLLGDWLKRRFNLRWFADFRDPWITPGQSPKHRSLKQRWLLAQERRVIKRADAVVLNAPRVCEALQSAYPAQAKKMLTLTNGYDPEIFELEPTPGTSTAGACEILHTGELYAGRDPRPLLEALRLLRAEGDLLASNFRVRFVGQVTTKFFESGFDLAGEISRRGLSDVVAVAGHSPYHETLRAMLAAGILLLVDSPGRKMGVPAKLYEYLGAGRPILALAEEDGDVAWVLRSSGAIHRLARPNDVAAIRRALSELMPLASSDQAGAQPGDRRHEFTRAGIARRLADAMRTSIEPASNRI